MPAAFAASSASAAGSVVLGEVTLNYSQRLVENSNGSYTLTLVFDAQSEHRDGNKNAAIARNGYYTAPADGDYLVELWGGDGGSSNGNGGNGGYVYGIVSLKKGETLFYTLGGNGYRTDRVGVGGGVNGPGGSAGELTSTTVGGGGGYSAVFLYGAGEFESGYFTDDGEYGGNSVTDSDRTSRFIMIAGGGGGGGGEASDGTYSPDGGAGGNMNSTAVSDSSAGVSGTVFAGSNGLSSSTDDNYVGEGGAVDPGSYSDSWTTLIKSAQGNNWLGNATADLPGGAGGAGNMNGGAGGAGYTGGGGGIMSTIFTNTSVGGGGGSSFLADSVDYASVDAGLLTGTDESLSGGYIVIQALGVDTSYLESVNVNIPESEYFQRTVSGTTAGANLDGGEALTLTLTFTRKDGFAGGNAVPLLEDERITVTAGGHTASVYLQPACSAVNVPLNFSIMTKSQTYDRSANDPVEPTVGAMYEDNYAAVRDSLADHWQYDFIESIGEYIVTDPNGTPLDDEDTVAPEATTAYPVSFTVTPKGRTPATVGIPVTTRVYSGFAKVFVTVGEEFVMGDITLSSQKELTVNGDGTFTLSLNVAGGGEATAYYVGTKEVTPEIEDLTAPNLAIGASATADGLLSKTSDTYTVKKAGWYLIQVWGASGGTGGSRNVVITANGGIGGTGGYVYGYRHFNVDDVITLDAGINGVGGSNGGLFGGETPGGGGGYSSVKVGSDYLLIAGGGGGGGSGHIALRGEVAFDGGPGDNGGTNSSDASDELNAEMPTYEGGGGNSGSSNTGGAAGANYRNSTVYVDSSAVTWTDNNTATTINNAASASNPNTDANGTTMNGGAAKITCLQLDPEEEYTYSDTEGGTEFNAEQYMDRLTAELQNYSLTVDISKYFDVEANDVTLVEGSSSTVLTHTTDGQTIKISGINPTVDCEELETTVGQYDFIASIDFTVNITLTPKNGFLGGNDVPLLKYGEPDSAEIGTSMVLGQTVGSTEHEEEIPRITERDFVNVAIPNNAVSGTIDASDELIEIVRGQTVGYDELYTVSGHAAPTGANAWTADFVDFNTLLTYEDGRTVTEARLAPTETTYYEVILSVDPKAEPVKATNTAATGVSVSKDRDNAGDLLVIYVLPVVEYHLTNLNNVNEYDSNNRYPVKPYGSNFEDTLSTYTAPNGKVYLLPDSITVTRTSGGTETTLEEGTDYEYNKVTGKITIDNSVLGYDLITIYAEGVLKEPLSITYYYQQSPDDTTGVQVAGPEFDSGDSLTADNAGIPEHTEYEGYSFGWQWLGYDEMPTTITDNLVAIGSYSPNPYTLTVRYMDEGGNVIKTATTQTVLYMEEYTVTAPAIDGYAPDQASITGTMDSTTGKTVTFTYHKTDGWLTIHYVKADGTQAAAPYTGEITLGESYTIASPAITGYTADLTSVVIGTVTQEQVNNGIVVTVTYTPNLYTISFNPNGGTCDTTPYRVEYNNVYGYDPINKTAKPLPTPILAGFTFDGWYLGDVKIESSTTVTITVDSTLVAKWTQITTYTLTIKYVYENGTQAAESYTAQLEAGAEYSEVSPLIDGYTADILTVSGTMGSDHALITVTYIKNARTVTVYYCYANGDPIDAALLGIAANPTLMELMPGDHTITAPALTGYTTPTAKTITVEPGVDMTITFYYTVQETVVSVTITWGELNFVYDGGVWQPESHTYDPAPSFTPEKTGYNTVTVINSAESTIPVDVTISYAANPGYATVDGYFTTASYSTGAVIEEWTLTVGEEKKVYLWLTGMLNSAQSGTFESGICTVTISSAGGE